MPNNLSQSIDNRAAASADQVVQVAIDKIVPNPYQPRKNFDPQSITELAKTIQQHGLLQPLVLRETKKGHFELVSGERRFRAIQSLKWQKVPAIVERLNNDASAALALIENVQRADLSAIEEAQAYIELMRINQYTQSELARTVGKSQAAVANKLRLLKLSKPAQEAINRRRLTERHGRALLTLPISYQNKLVKEILADQLTVKDTEAKVKAISNELEQTHLATIDPASAKKHQQLTRQNEKQLKLGTKLAQQVIKELKTAGVRAALNVEPLANGQQLIITLLNAEEEK